jgi:hypothetical protein
MADHKAEIDRALARHGADRPSHRPPDPAKEGKACLAAAEDTARRMKASQFRDRTAK